MVWHISNRYIRWRISRYICSHWIEINKYVSVIWSSWWTPDMQCEGKAISHIVSWIVWRYKTQGKIVGNIILSGIVRSNNPIISLLFKCQVWPISAYQGHWCNVTDTCENWNIKLNIICSTILGENFLVCRRFWCWAQNFDSTTITRNLRNVISCFSSNIESNLVI